MTLNETVWLGVTALVGGMLLAIALIDIRSYRIPNPLNFALISIGLSWAVFFGGMSDLWQYMLAIVAGYLAPLTLQPSISTFAR